MKAQPLKNSEIISKSPNRDHEVITRVGVKEGRMKEGAAHKSVLHISASLSILGFTVHQAATGVVWLFPHADQRNQLIKHERGHCASLIQCCPSAE